MSYRMQHTEQAIGTWIETKSYHNIFTDGQHDARSKRWNDIGSEHA